MNSFKESLSNSTSPSMTSSPSIICTFLSYFRLCDNWYDNEKALKELTDDEFAKLKIPVRLVNAIKEEIGTKNIPQPKNSPTEPPNNTQTSSKSGKPSMNEYTMVQYTTQL